MNKLTLNEPANIIGQKQSEYAEFPSGWLWHVHGDNLCKKSFYQTFIVTFMTLPKIEIFLLVEPNLPELTGVNMHINVMYCIMSNRLIYVLKSVLSSICCNRHQVSIEPKYSAA